MTRDPRLADQIDYYRRRAPEYDATSYGHIPDIRGVVEGFLDRLGPSGRTLEIACGTGIWTEHLAPRVSSLLALDAAPEALALARRRVRAHFVIADALALPVGARFDTIFFSAWMSHVPNDRFDEFWGQLVRVGDRVLFVDEYDVRRPSERFVDGAADVAERSLEDGSTHRLVKVFWSPEDLLARLNRLGWEATVTTVDHGWLIGSATRRPEPSPQ
jgi:demethylmenaquinone methyltransferase/2-methoxy-6-polyprenyl-1,4-benzoquinol methylase